MQRYRPPTTALDALDTLVPFFPFLPLLRSHHRGSRALLLSEHVPAALGENAVAPAHRVLGARDLAQEHRLQQDWRRREHRRVHYAAGGGHDLAHATVDGVGVEDHVEEVEPHTAHLKKKKHMKNSAGNRQRKVEWGGGGGAYSMAEGGRG